MIKSRTARTVGTTFLSEKALTSAVHRAVDRQGNPTPGFQRAVLSALTVQRPVVLANLRRLRRRYPEATPAELADKITVLYLRSLTTTGAAAGGAGVIPGIGTLATLGISAAGALGFIELTGLYAQSIAELNGVPTGDDQRGQALVMAIMLGDDGRRILAASLHQQSPEIDAGLSGMASASWIVTSLSGLTEGLFNRLQKSFFSWTAKSQSSHLLGRLVPFGIGAVIGGLGNRKLAIRVARHAQLLFGPVPSWHQLQAWEHPLALPVDKKLAKKRGGQGKDDQSGQRADDRAVNADEL
ncbi:hypothetical protein [Auritidibacter ignavus]|uniref:hypothetical protein n=1 Tax=Auritidibacter ignavus TaxID=678932 RepID=UPI0024B8EEC0|nr:hypothetical protein [Auritidibacter ignavus]WHS34004.1 hypothetical protein QM403_06380 [Auritidibacter ignavus]